MDEKTTLRVGVKLVGHIVMLFGVIGCIKFLEQSLDGPAGLLLPLPSLFEFVIGWYLAKHAELFILWFWKD